MKGKPSGFSFRVQSKPPRSGSGFAGTISTVTSQEPGAQVARSGFSVSRNSVSAAKDDIADWVQELGYAKVEQPAPDTGSEAHVLVAYFSQTGTTERVARQIAEYTGGDLAEIRRRSAGRSPTATCRPKPRPRSTTEPIRTSPWMWIIGMPMT